MENGLEAAMATDPMMKAMSHLSSPRMTNMICLTTLGVACRRQTAWSRPSLDLVGISNRNTIRTIWGCVLIFQCGQWRTNSMTRRPSSLVVWESTFNNHEVRVSRTLRVALANLPRLNQHSQQCFFQQLLRNFSADHSPTIEQSIQPAASSDSATDHAPSSTDQHAAPF
jgi:hypothetical protein